MLKFLEEDGPALNCYHGPADTRPELSPPAVAGVGEKSLSGMLETGVFRKQISAVVKCRTTDIRAASEDHLIGDPTVVGSLRNS